MGRISDEFSRRFSAWHPKRQPPNKYVLAFRLRRWQSDKKRRKIFKQVARNYFETAGAANIQFCKTKEQRISPEFTARGPIGLDIEQECCE